MTLAEQWRKEKPATFDSVLHYLDLLERLDDKAELKMTDAGPGIVFSDGSFHPMDHSIQ